MRHPPVASDAAIDSLVRGTHGDPFALLGRHGGVLRALLPGAEAVVAASAEGTWPLARRHPAGLFEGRAPQSWPYVLRITWPGGVVQETEDAYAFGLLLGPLDLYLFAEGTHRELGRVFGAQPMTLGGVAGVRFAVWAPNARRVSVVGDFNAWDGRRHPMRLRPEAGVWELFIPRLGPGVRYAYEILGAEGQLLPLKADPVALQADLPPSTASVVADPAPFAWTDRDWIETRAQRQSPEAPIAIYEVHPESWSGEAHDWDTLADRLIPHAVGLGFTHLELLPVMAHPFKASWGYQPLGLFAPNPRLGSPQAFARFVDRCHAAGLGVILDWVPAHFPTDSHGMGRFDGTALYEHADPREGFHRDWNTLIYNVGRHEVRAFLIASALHWLERYHADGLRVDAVASMLYRDYSRPEGEWIPNRYGGRENLEAIDFFRELTAVVHQRVPGAMLIAEESTAWPGVTRPPADGGLGFDWKWNMGWMNDTLRYFARDPIHRAHHHDEITFGLWYAWSERFILPLSHDEVVHGKRSLLAKMPGDDWQRFANLRALLALTWTHPGKKLLFMGGEIAQPWEWHHDGFVPWHLRADPRHAGIERLVADLNRLYRACPALYAADCRPEGFAWAVVEDRAQSVFAWTRRGGGDEVLVVLNLTPVPRHGYPVPVPRDGFWRELLNTDSSVYGGCDLGNAGGAVASGGVLRLTLPPLAALILAPGA
ncbi:MAG: 1,4-alpha-glucan branching protein GlgB [Acetobacteraceae bacterium]|nr:1,4-alpha-glucan branching protein GlgB [Acetobacteraceae bacterium]